MGEFDLIERFFTRPARRAAVGVGDDCAVFEVGAGMQLATSTDMLVEGRHFLSTVLPERLGHKALAVNLSDLAACGAAPLAFTLALALPRADAAFLEGFSRGLLALADAHGCELIGGDTTQGPLNICITVFGEVPRGQALLRRGARAGDDIYVSGTVGDARLALEVFRATHALDGAGFEQVRRAMELPQPRVALGQALRGIATSAIDVSDGLLGDLSHILRRSDVGAVIEADLLPRSDVMKAQPLPLQRLCTLAGGDDYELVFTAPADRAAAVLDAAKTAKVAVTRIGRARSKTGLELIDLQGRTLENSFGSFDHFRS
ncbi:thiamine-phosphate kinase [Piscinibacter terrae]|uniref:Thiamine-monophosphate kinase n=1 Tax=Piscinibacter terrae TaxID=2496871 RepID=A0A3N7HJX3_9BURK|nr:thiamine-phosphate kinase [Albitalea terrae]RQP22367.1 thiamine-phosphate kinase [Albitalea terrae]